MPLSQFEKELLTSPRYIGNKYDIAPYIRRFAQPGQDYHLTSIQNTMITCTGCQGNKFILQQHTDRFGSITKEKCPICNGRGVMSNRKEAGN